MMKEQTKVIVAVILGAAAGAVLGMLVAPEKGADSRRKLSAFANDLLESAVDLVQQSTEYTADENNETPLGV